MVDTIFQPQNYTVIMPFRPARGGRGIAVSPTNAASPAALLNAPVGAQSIMLTNDGLACFWVAFGGPSVVATLADIPVLPGNGFPLTLPNDGNYTHFSTITRSGSSYGTINFGLGS